MTIRRLLMGALFSALLTGACSAPEEPVEAALAEARSYAEIDRWADALEVYRALIERRPEDPVVRFHLALALYRTGEGEQAALELAEVGTESPPSLRARCALLSAQLAYESGESSEEGAALLRAAELMPDRAEYSHAMAELARRDPTIDRAFWVSRAYELWPENSRLALDFAQWSFEAGEKARSLAILGDLASGRPEIERYLELVAATVGQGTPSELRIAINLLRSTKRFQNDAAELDGLLQLTPVVEVVAEAARLVDGEPSALTFEQVMLLPLLAEGGEVIDVEILDDASDAPDGLDPVALRQAGLVVATEDAVYVLERSSDRFESILGLEARPIDLLAGDLDDDGLVEVLVFDESGMRVFSRPHSGEWAVLPLGADLSDAGHLRSPLLVDFDHDGDLDLIVASPEGGLRVSLNRGEAGLGELGQATFTGIEELGLEKLGTVTSVVAADLDTDSDQDLLLTAADEIVVLRNWRQAEFRLEARIPAAGVEGVLVVDLDGDRFADLVTFGDTCATSIWKGEERFRWGAGGELTSSVGVSVADLGDFDLDGDLDLVTAGTDLEVWPSAHRSFAAPVAALAAPESRLVGVLTLDLDEDKDPDLVAWGPGGLSTWRSRGGEAHSWLELALRSPERKVPRDGHGVRIEASFGDQTRWWQLDRANPIIGLGPDVPSVVKATWSNGISEYLFRPAANERHKLTLELRIEGSCPFLYASDGSENGEMRFVTDILGLSPLGMLMDAEHYVQADPEEYLRLPDWVAREGLVELRLTEELREVAYLDQIELLVVDAPSEVVVYNHERWIPAAVEGPGLLWLEEILPPLSVVGDRGDEVLDIVLAEDHLYLENHSGEIRYQGAVPRHRMTIELPRAVASASRPGLLMVGWLHWGNTSTNVARSQDPGGAPIFPYLEVEDAAGEWQRTEIEVGLPAGKTKPVVVDLGPIAGVLGGDRTRVRLTTDFEVYWDRVAAVRLRDAPQEHVVHRLALDSAELRFEGFSRWFRPAPNGPYLFDYQQRRGIPVRNTDAGRELAVAWLEHEGRYSAFGRVDDLLAQADDRAVVFGSGEGLALTFDLSDLPRLPSVGWSRTLFFHSEGWEKDGDPNVACSQTVDPMPSRGMVAYPCGNAGDGSLRSASAASIDEDRRTRWVSRHRLERRVELATKSGSGALE